MQYEVYHSAGNYSSAGRLESLPTSNSFWEATPYTFDGRYAFSPTMAMTAGVNYVQVQSNIANTTKQNAGFQTLQLGLEYKLTSQVIEVIAEGVGQLAMFSVDESSTRPVYGDGAHAIGGNLWLIKRWGPIQLKGRGGFLFRTDGLSGLIPYQLGAAWRIKNWTLGVMTEGAWSTMNDSEGENKRTAFLTRANGGSLHYRSANPSPNIIDVQARWDLTNQFSFVGGMGNNFTGRNSSDGARYFVGMDLRWQVFQPRVDQPILRNALPPRPKPSTTDDSTPLYQEEDLNQNIEERPNDSL